MMKNNLQICVIGGGIAGLSAAVFLAEKGYDITVFEASNRLGGRASSFYDNTFGRYIDNGQHILASWYTSTFEFLKIIGSFEKLSVQNGFEAEFREIGNKRYLLRFPQINPPFNILNGLIRYKAISIKDIYSVKKLINFINSRKDEIHVLTALELLMETGQSQRLIDNFWKPFIISVFNAKPEDTSALMFAYIISIGFLKKNMSNLAIPECSLSELYIKPTEEFLKKCNVKILTSCRVTALNITNNIISSVTINKTQEMKFDYYIVALPYFEYKNIFNQEVLENNFNKSLNLKPSAIVNIHHKIKLSTRDINLKKFFGVLNGKTQWIFKTYSDDNEISLCSVISAANAFNEIENDTLINISRDEIKQLIPEMKNAEFIYSKVIKEKRATFIPDNDSASHRLNSETKYKNLFLTGDWIQSELPSTLESAVRNSKKCISQLIQTINSN